MKIRDDIEILRNDLQNLVAQLEGLRTDAEKIRLFYKYQNEEMDSESQAFIVSYENGDYESAIIHLDELAALHDEFICE